MKPEPFTAAQAFIKAAEGWPTEEMGTLHDIPAYVGKGVTISMWRPSKEELALLQGGGMIMLTQCTTQPPSAQLEVYHTAHVSSNMPRA